MTPEEVREIVMSFPGAEEGVSYGQPAFKVNGKFFTRLRGEDGSLVLLGVSFDEREMLMEALKLARHALTECCNDKELPADGALVFNRAIQSAAHAITMVEGTK